MSINQPLWEDATGFDVSSAFQGVTTPLADLYNEIHQRHWQVTGVNIKDGMYEASAKNPMGESASKFGKDEKTALAALLLYIVRKEFIRQGSWNRHWADQLEPIAQAYAKAPSFDPQAAMAWKELADDCVARAHQLKQQIAVEYTDDPVPYHSPQELFEDVTKHQHILVSRAASEHPVWTPEQVLAFRTVHNILGHAAAGGDFGWTGENLATAAHMPYLSPNAQRALFTETVGQKAYNHFYQGYGHPKIVFLNDHLEDIQSEQNPDGHAGLPVNHSLSPGALPERSSSVERRVIPTTNLWASSRLASLKRDPNYKYETGLGPIIDVPGEYGDPLNHHELRNMGHMLNTNWAQWKTYEDKPDYERMKQAIVNAFRVAVLSPLKDLKWNAAHYQDLQSIPYSVTDPKIYWDTLEHARIEYNRAQGIPDPEVQHKEHYRSGALLDFYRYYMAHHPELNAQQAKEAADREVMVIRAEIEEKLMEESKDVDMDILEPKIDKELNKALKQWVSDDKPLHKRTSLEAPHIPAKVDRYGGFIGRHLIAIARISLYADQLLEAALEDVRNHDGSGHMFRAMALSLNIPYVGAKVASFAWLLLQPLTSQLATIDTHMCDVLGVKQKDLPKRDYFRAERELQAGRDSCGYGHMPLGLFQWGMWDMRRHGVNQDHQDHSALRVDNPTPWRNIDWKPSVPKLRQEKAEKWIAPDWWAATDPYRQQERAAWNIDVAPFYPQESVPWKRDPFIVQSATDTSLGLEIPDHMRQKIAEWLSILELEGAQLVNPDDYHITLVGCEHVPEEVRTNIVRRFNTDGISVRVGGMSVDHTTGVISLEVESKALSMYGGEIVEWLYMNNPHTTSYGLNSKIVLGWSDTDVIVPDCAPYSFRVGPTRWVESSTPYIFSVERRKHCPECQGNLDFFGKCTDCGWQAPTLDKPTAVKQVEPTVKKSLLASRGHSIDPVWGPRTFKERMLARLGIRQRGIPVYEHPKTATPNFVQDRPWIFDGMALHLGGPGGHHGGVAKAGGFFHDWRANRAAYHHGVIYDPSHTPNAVQFYGKGVGLTPEQKANIVGTLGRHTNLPLQEYNEDELSNDDLFTAHVKTATRVLAKEGVFYHVAPAAARESIALHGLHPSKRTKSPWSDLNKERSGYPEGTFLWEHPANARLYSHSLADNLLKEQGKAPKPNDYLNPKSRTDPWDSEVENLMSDYNLVDDGSGNVYVSQWPDEEDDGSDINYGPEERDYDHETDRHELLPHHQGWDIWEVRMPEKRVHPDPEPLWDYKNGQRAYDPNRVIPYNTFVKDPQSHEDEDIDHTEMRWFTPHQVPKENVRLHEHIPYVSIAKAKGSSEDHPLNWESLHEEAPQIPEIMSRVGWPHYEAYRHFLTSQPYAQWDYPPHGE